MKTNHLIIDCCMPDEVFWEAYATLWKESVMRSVFQAPNYIRMLGTVYRNDIAVCRYSTTDGQLKGATFFRKEGHAYRFLSDLKSDHNFIVFHNTITAEETADFFHQFFEAIKKKNWSLILNNHPFWAPYMDMLAAAGRASGLFYLNTRYSVCPLMQAETPQALLDEIRQSREHRTKTNRLMNEQKAVLEIFYGDEYLDEWLEQFCKLHIERWENTAYPSKYKDPEQKVFLRECILAWIKDEVIARFSISLGGKRIAFVIGFMEEQTLIHHSTSYDATYYKISPGKVLTMLIIQWMAERGLNRLDFGEGAEEYKYAYANTNQELGRIFISPVRNLPFILKAKYKDMSRKHLKSHPKLKNIYHNRIWPAGLKLKAAILSLAPIDLDIF